MKSRSDSAMTLAYQLYGDHDSLSPPLVMVHGFLGSGKLFAPNIAVLQKTLPIITVDLAGFGNSNQQTGATTIRDMATQVLATIKSITPAPFYLLGHSMGGMVVLQMAVLDNARILKLVPYATAANGQLRQRFETFDESKARLRADFTAAKQHICATWFKDGARHPHFAAVLQDAQVASLTTALNALDAMASHNLTEQLHIIKQPTLIIGAQHDKTYSPACLQQLHQLIPHAQHHTLQNCAHNAHLENQEEFNQTLLDWL